VQFPNRKLLRHHVKGHIFFEEGSPGPLAYVIKSGQVEITKKQGNKEITIAMLGPAEIFGEMALLGAKERTATAIALANTEVISISQTRLLSFFRQSDPILKHVITSLINRLEMATTLITQDKMDDIYASVCQIIVLVANQESTPTDENGKRLLPYTSVIEQLRGILSIDAADCHLILEKLEAINLIEIVQIPLAKDKSIRLIDEENFVQRAERVSKELEGAWSDHASQRSIYLDLYDLCEQTGIEREKIYKKIGTGEVPKEFVFFKKEDILKWVQEVGQAFFDKKKRITADDLDSIESIS
jgi:CRP-like cAMP-binding protein